MSLPNEVNLHHLGSTGYNIARSVRLRSSASAYLSRTPASATNRTTWTWSGWVKRGKLGVLQGLFDSGGASTGGDLTAFGFNSSDQITFYWNSSSGALGVTTAVFRDPSAWYHVVVSVGSGSAKIYVNNTLLNTFSISGSGAINNTSPHAIGAWWDTGYSSIYNPFDGYLTEINFIDGQALTPSSFGSTNAITGVWQPAKYTGTYGTNGFYLNFSSNGTAAALGTDFSGNSNTWTVNNISVTAGSTYDSVTDVPTLTSATASNYCVMNPLSKNNVGVIYNGNLAVYNTTLANYPSFGGTMHVSSGKWYWEVVMSSSGTFNSTFGFTSQTAFGGAYQTQSGSVGITSDTGAITKDGSTVSTGSSFTYGDVIGIALNLDAGTATFYKNNSATGSVVTGLSGSYTPAIAINYYTGGVANINFGQQPFTYTPPTGFVALNTYNLPDSTITNGAAYMAATTYTGAGGTQSVTNTVNGISFQPDFVWNKCRDVGYSHYLEDSVRGVTKVLRSAATQAETTETDALTAFNSNGFTVGGNASTNNSGNTYVAWQWKAGTTSATNTNGSITSTVSVGATQGFSVVTFTGNATGGATVGHGLGVAPSMVIVKSRSNGVLDWNVYHVSQNANPASGALTLNSTAAFVSDNTYWNGPTGTFSSTVFSIGSGAANNLITATYVAYCFAAVKGYSAFGSYTGNGSTDGTFVYTGFRPRFVLIKISSGSTGSWWIWDSGRNTFNAASNILAPDQSSAEISPYNCDLLSNGFKLRDVTGALNGSGYTFIYASFAENPFQNALAR